MKLTLLIMPTIHSVVTATAAASLSRVGDVRRIVAERVGHPVDADAAGEGDAGQHELADELPARPSWSRSSR